MTILPGQYDIEVNAVMDIAFTGQSNHCFYFTQRSGTLLLGDLRTRGIVVWRKQGHAHKANLMKVSEDGYRVATSAKIDEIKLWDVRKIRPLEELKGYIQTYTQHMSRGLPLGLDFLLNEKFLVSGSDDGAAYIYETLSGELVTKVKLGRGQVQTACALSPDSVSFYTSFLDAKYFGLVDTEGDSIVHAPKSTEDIKSGFVKQAWDAVIAKYTDQILSIVRTLPGTPLGHEGWMQAIRDSDRPDCKRLASSLAEGFEQEKMAGTPSLVRELADFFTAEKEQTGQSTTRHARSRKKYQKSSMAPKVRTESGKTGRKS